MPARRSASYTVAGAPIAALVGYVKLRGADLTPELDALGMKLDDLVKPDFRVPVAACEKMWEHAAARVGEPDFALRFAKLLDLDGFHLIGHLAVSSATVEEALNRVVEFSRLLHDAGRTELEHAKGGRVLLFPGCRGLPVQPPKNIAEFNTASAVVLIRYITAKPEWAPREVHFHHAAPDDVKPHRELFGVAPSFDAPEDVLVLDASDLKLPVRVSAKSRVGDYLESYARTLLAKLPEKDDDLRGQVLRAIITSLPHGALGIEPVAARLAMTPRTLQRRLAETGDSFSDLIDEARQSTATHYLADDRFSLGEISYLLGFNEPSTFHKAFRRWKGVPPGEWREQHH